MENVLYIVRLIYIIRWHCLLNNIKWDWEHQYLEEGKCKKQTIKGIDDYKFAYFN